MMNFITFLHVLQFKQYSRYIFMSYGHIVAKALYKLSWCKRTYFNLGEIYYLQKHIFQDLENLISTPIVDWTYRIQYCLKGNWLGLLTLAWWMAGKVFYSLCCTPFTGDRSFMNIFMYKHKGKYNLPKLNYCFFIICYFLNLVKNSLYYFHCFKLQCIAIFTITNIAKIRIAINHTI